MACIFVLADLVSLWNAFGPVKHPLAAKDVAMILLWAALAYFSFERYREKRVAR